MSGLASVKEIIQGQDVTLKMFEQILKKKLDVIFKQKSTYPFTPLEMENVTSGCLQNINYQSD